MSKANDPLVLAQAVLLASISLPPGVLTGIALAYAIHRGSASWAGPQAGFQIDGLLILGACVLAVGMAVLASLAPARLAVRLSVSQALHHT